MHPDLKSGIISIQNGAMGSDALIIIRVFLAPINGPMGIAQYGFKFA